MRTRRKGLIGSLLAGSLAFTLALGSPAFANDTPTPQPPSATQAPIPPTSSAAPAPTTADRVPLPEPVYQNTPAKVKDASEMAPGACQTLVPEAGFVPPKDPWHLERLQMDEAWKIATGAGIKIAVIDTGISIQNSGHTPTSRFSAYDVLPPRQNEEPGTPMDCQHGTVVASLIGAQRAGNDTNFSGIAPDASIIGIRALYGNAQQEIDGVVAAVRAAIAMDVDIINISQAAIGNRGEYADAISAALEAGIVVVAAAGNGNDQSMPAGTLAYPAVYPGVISVGMTNQADVADPASLIVPGYVSVAAPGVDMLSTGPSSAEGGQVYQRVQRGTSYAAPVVSGVVALMLEQARDAGRDLSPAEVKAILEATADPPAGPVPDPQLGHGIVNPMRALSGLLPPATDQVPPKPSPSYAPMPPPARPSKEPLYWALRVAGISLALVALGLGLYAAIPAARRRGGRPADPHEAPPVD